MQDLCPLCLKNGFKKKIRLLQINLQEAVWMCEEEKCVWPLGFEDFIFHPRLVGKIWSCYWDNNTASRLKENVILPAKPSLCNDSVISVKNTSKECIDLTLDTNSSEENNIINNDLNTIDSKSTNNDLHIPTQKELSITSCVNTKEKFNVNNSTLNKNISESSLNNNNLHSDINEIKNGNIENKCINQLSKSIKEENDISPPNIKYVNNIKGIPKITNIEKTDINISNIKGGNELSLNQDQNNLSKSKASPKVEPSKSDQLFNEVTKPNLNVTMMKIDGLPPITLSFEMPASTTALEIVTCNTQQTGCKTNVTEDKICSSRKSHTLGIKGTSVKRNVSSGKLYEKFSFSAIKKKMETKESTNVSSNSNNSLNAKADLKMKNVGNDTIDNVKKSGCTENIHDNQSTVNYKKDCKETISVPDVPDTSMLNQVNNCEFNLPSQEDISNTQDISIMSNTSLNSSVNIDTVLTDFLTNDYSVSEDINDEWINSLLS